MHHPSLFRRVLFVLFAGAWLFLLLALGSFKPTDWPSHAVYPYPATQNLCGAAGAYVAYYTFFALGQGVFPILFFGGICIALALLGNRVSDLWLRSTGILVLSVAFACAVHFVRPGGAGALPEGNGGILGIGAAAFLRAHCNGLVASLILACSFLVGLLLAADDLVVRLPGFVGTAISSVREMKARAPQVNWNIVPLPKLPSLPRFVTRDAVAERLAALLPAKGVKPVKSSVIASAPEHGDEPGAESRRPVVNIKPRSEPMTVITKATKTAPLSSNSVADQAVTQVVTMPPEEEDIHLEYESDDNAPAMADSAFLDDEDPEPSVAATIPPPAQQAVPIPPPPPRPEIVVKLPNMLKPRQISPPNPPPPKELGEYHFPAWDCLADAENGYAESQEKFVREQAVILEQALREFNIDANVVEIDTGPVITMYEISLAPGIKVSSITALSNDIMRALKAESVRIVAPVPGKNTVGIEVPNQQKEKVRFKELMALAPESSKKYAIPLYLGKDASGEPLITDLAAMPHGLIAGTTGSGKSVCINTIIMSIIYKQRPDMVKLILFDPKVVEMAMYKDIPHLMCPVINDSSKATSVLEWACEKMDERYEFLAEAGVRHLKDYNKLSQEELFEKFQPSTPEEEAKIPKKLPYIVIIIDELADLMMTSGKEAEAAIVRIAQKARAVGIHLILATQRPSANVVTGLIKSNMPTRIAFRVQSKMDSRIVLDQNGAECLLGQGDMLYMGAGASKPVRSQGTFIDDREVRESVKVVRALADAQYEPELVQIKSTLNANGEIEKDDLFDDAVRVVLETKRGSVSLLQRRLTIGYARASRLIEQMAQTGILGDYKGSQAREVNFTVEEWEAMQTQAQADADSGMSV